MLIIKKCLTCRKEFKTNPCYIKTGRGKYCSRKCTFWEGRNNLNWKGNDVGYGALHHWVYRKLGHPKKCEDCETTIAKRYEWANISKKYKRDISDWKRFCSKCHRAFDKHSIVKGEKHG